MKNGNVEKENSYFMQVVREAVQDLKQGATAYVFSKEQVDYIMKNSNIKEEIVLRESDGIYYLKIVKPVKKADEDNE